MFAAPLGILRSQGSCWFSDLHWQTSTYSWLCFYQTRSAWSMDQGSNKNHSPVNNFAPTVTKFCVMWEGQALPHDTKFGNCRGRIVDSRMFPSWSLIHGLSWSSLIKAEPGDLITKAGNQWDKDKTSLDTLMRSIYDISHEICTPFWCALFCCGWVRSVRDSCNSFVYIHQVCFSGIETTSLHQSQWINPENYD